jgi:uncharacterized OB-fold protein
VSAGPAPGATTGATGALTIREFFDGVREGRLVVQQCEACRALAVPPKAVCPECEAQSWRRVPLAGEGEVASFTVIRVAPARLAPEAPYVVAVVRMREGVNLLGRLAGLDVDRVTVGLPVAFLAPPAGVDPVVIAFRPR